jgi:hypothetical protein
MKALRNAADAQANTLRGAVLLQLRQDARSAQGAYILSDAHIPLVTKKLHRHDSCSTRSLE